MFSGIHGERQTLLLAVTFVITALVVAVVAGPQLTRRHGTQAEDTASAQPLALVKMTGRHQAALHGILNRIRIRSLTLNLRESAI